MVLTNDRFYVIALLLWDAFEMPQGNDDTSQKIQSRLLVQKGGPESKAKKLIFKNPYLSSN